MPVADSYPVRARNCLVALLLIVALAPAQLRAEPEEEPSQPGTRAPVLVEIEGVDKQLETNVLLFLSIEQQKSHPLMSDGRIRRLHQKAKAEITAALQPFGYYRPEVNASLEKLETGEWRARYQIDPGPGLLISELNLDISGPIQQDPDLLRLVEAHAPQPGTVLVHSRYDSFKSRLSGLAAEHGYVEAKFSETRLEVDLREYVARIIIRMQSGPRYSFGEVSMQQDLLDPELLQRYVPFAKGEPYNFDQVISLQHALNDSNYFQYAEVSPGQPSRETREIPISVKLAPRKRHRYDFGVGYGTDTGARAKFNWRMPRVNEHGHRIDTEFIVSEIGYKVNANYRVPVLNPRSDQLVYTVSREKEDTDSNFSLLTTIGVSLNHAREKWRETLALNYQVEDFDVADDSGESVLLIPSAGWTRTWGSDFINVLDGVRVDFALRGGTTALVSDTDFLQGVASVKFIYSLDPSNRFLLRGTLGATETPDFEQLPSSIRFFAGGAQSVRGYAYKSLGPTNEFGDVVGGSHLIIGSIEFEHYFNERWGVAAFIDTGNAIDSLNEDLEQGAGFGMRWKSPVGPVRVDLANAISTEEKDWRLHISIGPDL